MLRQLVIWPHPILEMTSAEVPADMSVEALKRLTDDMIETMLHHNGVGLAAPQIGLNWRIFVTCADSLTTHGEPRVFINPVVMPVRDLPASTSNGDALDRLLGPRQARQGSRLVDRKEGCLSFPGLVEERKRYDQVMVHAQDLEGREHGISGFSEVLDGLLGHCAQHEVEHLDGHTFAKDWGKVKRDMMKRKMDKIKRRRP